MESKYMTFSQALNLIRAGMQVARLGWNGKGMWLTLVNGGKTEVEGAVVEMLPWVCMKTADDKLVPWLASQTDLLADDWVIVK